MRNVWDNSSSICVLCCCIVRFDHEKDGVLGMSDIRSIMLNIGEKLCDCEIKEMLAASDLTEPSGGITYDNFMKLLSTS